MACHEAGRRKHKDRGEDVGEGYCWDDGFNGSDLREPVIGCMVIFEWGLDVVEEVVERGYVADAAELEEDSEDGWSVLCQ